MRASYLALMCGLLPTLTVHFTWVLASAGGNLHWCNPYWMECHSISATGRQYPEFFFFKGLMIPVAVIMLVYWTLLHTWLRKVSGAPSYALLACGLFAGVALIIYSVTLGAIGEPYAVARRMGIVLFFGLTAFAHLLLLAKLRLCLLQFPALSSPYLKLRNLCAWLLSLGVLSALLGFFWDDYDRWENAVEWWFALLMMGQFVWVARMWHISHFGLQMHMKQ